MQSKFKLDPNLDKQRELLCVLGWANAIRSWTPDSTWIARLMEAKKVSISTKNDKHFVFDVECDWHRTAKELNSTRILKAIKKDLLESVREIHGPEASVELRIYYTTELAWIKEALADILKKVDTLDAHQRSNLHMALTEFSNKNWKYEYESKRLRRVDVTWPINLVADEDDDSAEEGFDVMDAFVCHKTPFGWQRLSLIPRDDVDVTTTGGQINVK